MSEWPNVQAWKVCVPQGTAGSNPALSAERDLPDKKGEVPFFISPVPLDNSKIPRKKSLTLNVRTVLFSRL